MNEQKIDFLYIFNFQPPAFEGAIERLRCSIQSIKDQNVNICLSNNSEECILYYIQDIDVKIRYIHKPYSKPFSRALAINFAVKNLILTDYFIMSDIDLIYQSNHVETMLSKVQKFQTDQPIRYVTYNYNEEPFYSNRLCYSKNSFIKKIMRKLIRPNQPAYSSDFDMLIKLPNNGGGFAHGNGLIHLESFIRIKGYDEEMIGYGPEDDLFNTRISKINYIVYDNDISTATVHLWHPRYHMIQHKKNMQIWQRKKKFYNSLQNPKAADVMGNKSKKDWGVI